MDLAATIDAGVVREAFPQWRITGTEGCWFAIRGGTEHSDGPLSLLRCALSASTLLGLAEKLCLQEYLDGLDEHELEDIWRHASLPQRPALRVVS